MTQGPNLFRQESLERLSSPERLDQLMQVIGPKAWLPLATSGVLVIAAVTWSVVGRIPITVEGQGVLIRPSKVVHFQSGIEGQLVELKVRSGDPVRKGQVLATIDQTELRQQLELERAKLAQLQGQDRDANSLQGQRVDLDQKTIEQQRQTLQQSLQATQSVTPILREKGLLAVQQNRQSLQQRLQTFQELSPTLKKRWDNRQGLFEQGAVPADVVLQAQQEYLGSLANISDAESQLKQLDVKEADAQRQYLQNLSTITNLQAQLRELDSKAAQLAQQNLENSTNRKNQIEEVQRNIARLEGQLKGKSSIVSEYNGRVLEIAAVPGQVLTPGLRLGSIDAEDPNGKLTNVAYFAVRDGKQIKPGMSMQITPNTVKRERFGGILGRVKNVSSFPVTAQGAVALVGSEAIVKSLMPEGLGAQVEVLTELQEDPSTESGYRWSSSDGPPLQVTSGTTTLVRVKVDEQAPIAYIIPLLRSTTGIY
ncbi:NHLP bacteriocin system secretion protein [Leptolyngbya sp. FACHB-261]|uniref:NHLP bacteriocin system secretion protein n=1 Tax=Leptolyngbya sp. FACHB-261 TaxID=2692806 RepID=UPI00168A093B|nr:NHLP bacteriocin system secretion protein [Leptolyngbya sp. FACHB-261]MBD2104013.1 NHLP bacteriocin system secretion protein [Leptolyngbya sp. FACHB-261]